MLKNQETGMETNTLEVLKHVLHDFADRALPVVLLRPKPLTAGDAQQGDYDLFRG